MLMRTEVEHKAKKGVVRVSILAEQIEPLDTIQINQINITGDFFFHPEEKLNVLESILNGSKFPKIDSCETLSIIEQKISAFYQTEGIISPGLRPRDFAEALFKALESLRNK